MQRSSLDSARARASSAGSEMISSGSTAIAVDIVKSVSSAMTRRCLIDLLRRQECGLAPRRLGRPHAQTSIRERQRTADHHHYGAEPDEQHQRLVIEPHGERAVWIWIAERQVELGSSPRHERGFSDGGAARRKAAFCRLHHADDVAVAAHREMGSKIAVVGTLARGHAVELKIIAPDRD